MEGLFITGTDTDVGKTLISSLLANAFCEHIDTTYFKPVQAGRPTDTDWVKGLGHKKLKFKEPTYLLESAMSPDRAATKENRLIDLDLITSDWLEREPGFYIVEGAGGLEVPLNKCKNMIDLIVALKLPTVLVASTRLGTINHTLLSVKALQQKGVTCLGVILNGEKDEGLRELLEEKSGVPVLFEVPWLNQLTSDKISHFSEEHQNFRAFVDFCLTSPREEELATRTTKSWLAADSDHVWHPFTQHGIVKNHPLVTRGEGSYLWLEDHKVLDAISSWWVNLFGHCHPRLSQAVSRQAEELEHVIFAGFSHRPAIELSEKLVRLTRQKGCDLSKVFFSDNGSTAVEVALKMAYQHFQVRGRPEKNKFLALTGSYHGDTLGAMATSDRGGFNKVFTPLMFDVDFVDPFNIAELEQIFERRGDQYAAVIVEPMVQGASGMRMYSPEFLNRLADFAKRHEVLVICDEIFTGFYRTGRVFAFEHSKLRPDLLCLSKGLTGGYLPLSVTMTTDSMFESFKGDSMAQAFLHGHSYTANPIACRVACASMDLLCEEGTAEKIKEIEEQTAECLQQLQQNPRIFNTRQLGTIGAMDMIDEDPGYFKGGFSYRFNQKAMARGVLLRPLGGTVYAVPPYSTTKEEIKKIYSVINEIASEEL